MKQYKRLGLDPTQQLFVHAFDGDALSTRKRILVSWRDEASGETMENLTEEEARSWVRCDWFTEALHQRSEREAKLAAQMRRDDLRAAIADRTELQALWSAVARGEQTPVLDPDTKLPVLDKQGKPVFHPIPSMRDRLAAAKMLADSLGMSLGTLAVEGGEKPIKVTSVDLDERIKLVTGAARITAHQPALDWLQ